MSTDIEVHSNNPFQKVDLIEQVGTLHLKGYKQGDIAEITGLNRKTVREYITLFQEHLQETVENDPYFLEQVQLNTLKILAEYDEVAKEAWETVEIATREGMTGTRVQALKLALDVSSKRAAVLQLMGVQKTDTEYIARMQKAETVNSLVSNSIRDVVAHCDVCSSKLQPVLREIFAMMADDREGFDSPDEAASHLDIENAVEITE